jgi:hypothetical protein
LETTAKKKSLILPAAFKNVIGVGSANYDNRKTALSNYGKELEKRELRASLFFEEVGELSYVSAEKC